MTKVGLLNPYLGSQQSDFFPPEVPNTQQFPLTSLKAVQSHQGPIGPLLNTSSGPSSAV